MGKEIVFTDKSGQNIWHKFKKTSQIFLISPRFLI